MTPTVPATEPVPETCGEAFNSAWQCYGASTSRSVVQRDRRATNLDAPATPSNSPAPTFQLTQYYRYGELDSCAGRWAAIWACMDKSKRYARGTGRGRGFAIARKYPSVALRAGLHPTPSPSDPTLMRSIPPHSSLNRAEMDRA
jgi:hypothetical protein